MALANRIAKELKDLAKDPPPGVCVWPEGNNVQLLSADVEGPRETVYEGGVFRLSVVLPDRYPMEPPKIQFKTRVHHPNVDGDGRICLDILNMPPKGSWSPARNLSTVLMSIQLLLASPNPDDGLVVDVTEEFKYNRVLFDTKARQMTKKYAVPGANASSDASAGISATVPPAPQHPHQQQQQQATAAADAVVSAAGLQAAPQSVQQQAAPVHADSGQGRRADCSSAAASAAARDEGAAGGAAEQVEAAAASTSTSNARQGQAAAEAGRPSGAADVSTTDLATAATASTLTAAAAPHACGASGSGQQQVAGADAGPTLPLQPLAVNVSAGAAAFPGAVSGPAAAPAKRPAATVGSRLSLKKPKP